MTAMDSTAGKNQWGHPLVRWYLFLVLLAAAATFQALLFPRWPRTTPLRTEPIRSALRTGGFAPSPLAPLPSRRNQELATSEVLGYELGGGEKLLLMSASVRQYHSFQTAFIGRDRPELTLANRRIGKQQPPFSQGTIDGRATRQICLVPGIPGKGGFGTTIEDLTGAAERNVSSATARVQSLLGLLPNRTYECVLISLSAARGTSLSPGTWEKLLATLQPALQPDRQPPGRV